MNVQVQAHTHLRARTHTDTHTSLHVHARKLALRSPRSPVKHTQKNIQARASWSKPQSKGGSDEKGLEEARGA